MGEPILVPFCTSLNAYISGTRKVIKKQSKVFFPVFLYLHIHFDITDTSYGFGEMVLLSNQIPGAPTKVNNFENV